jgi:polysaccharide biosynthesis transport protein
VSIFQFLRIVWASRLLIGLTTVASVIGALVVTLIIPPTWQAETRVMMGLLKPDPVTGEVVPGPAARAYVATQIELVTDYSVAGRVADQMGWLSDPVLIAAYNRRPANDKRDFRRWLADIVISNTKAEVLEGSNILDIKYGATTPDASKAVADALRTAYIDASLDFKRDEAKHNAEWFETQANAARGSLDTAQTAESTFEKQNHIVMADDTTDVDAARLRALTTEGVSAPMMAAPAAGSSPASLQLAQIDAQIVEAEKALGPNHPGMLALRAQRAALAQQVAQDQAAQRAASSAAVGAAASASGAVDRAVQAATARMVADSDKRTQLSELQNEVNLRRDQFVKTSQKAAEFREEAAIADTGLTPLGAAVTPKAPVFPNYMIIVPGSLFLGLIIGALVALLVELFRRRVRSVEDLTAIADAPLLAVIAPPPVRKNARRFRVFGSGRGSLVRGAQA